ncbi:MAG: coproporphyrinogen III oxidase family protein [Bacteroidaceae bacterium]|nr:coproporphyrinogen III oxidase family protein [Bacteroidaceae bacterium]
MAGIYVHIPFCQSRCAYCDFFSTTRVAERDAYVHALCREIEARRDEQTGEGKASETSIGTIYFGGGTPSTLSSEQIGRILDCICSNYHVDPDAEVTLEMNPDDCSFSTPPLTSPAWAGACRGSEDSLSSGGHEGGSLPAVFHPEGGAGRRAVNRVSLGIQTFDDDLLRLIRRRHDARGAVEAVRRLQGLGINNISIDLIYGLPGQTLEQWQRDLDIAFSLGIQHLSAYSLSYEHGTALSRWREEGRISEAPDDLSVAMYERLCQQAREAGFEHYEISNFALAGFRSRHNSSYWCGSPYLGCGPGAHSFDGQRIRRANSPDLDLYLRLWSGASEASQMPCQSVAPGKAGRSGCSGGTDQSVTVEILSDAELYDEAVMCGLRTSLGVSLDDISQRFGRESLDYLLRMARPHIQASRLVAADGRLRLSEKALMISDDIMSDLMA